MVAPSHLKSLQAVELAARLGSLTAAAERLGLTPAAVGQRVKLLEEFLGVDLLVRGRSGIRATPELEAALPHLASAFADLELAAAVLEMQRGHELHIAATLDFAELWLIPRLESFRSTHPNIRFRINGDGDAPLRLGQVDCEIAFRAVDGRSDLLFRDYLVPLGSPENCTRTAALPATSRLEGFPLLHLDFYRNDAAAPDWPEWIAKNGLDRTAPDRGMRFQRITSALDAVMADAGLVICGLGLLAPLLDERRVALPFSVGSGSWTSHGFQARFRADATHRPHVKRFRAWLVAQAAVTQNWIEHWMEAQT